MAFAADLCEQSQRARTRLSVMAALNALDRVLLAQDGLELVDQDGHDEHAEQGRLQDQNYAVQDSTLLDGDVRTAVRTLHGP